MLPFHNPISEFDSFDWLIALRMLVHDAPWIQIQQQVYFIALIV
jgi:hypothetical protein